MKASQLVLQNLLEVNAKTGIIHLQDKRMILMSVEALGILRSDLVNTLGLERAKGFLMRYGWSCGYRAAESVATSFHWNSLKELLLAGPTMHTLEGVATVIPDFLRIDEDSLEFSGYWENSYEADEHLEKHGISNYGVCWTLQGYASGYLTKVFGKDVIAYEKYCRAKGDDHCYFVAKTVEHCEPEHLKDMRYYQTESLQDVLEDMYLEMERLNEDIIESEQVQNELTELFLEGKEIQDILCEIGKKIGCSLVVDQEKEKIASYYEQTHHEENYDVWQLNNEYKRGKMIYYATFPINSHQIKLGRLVVMSEDELSNRNKLIINRALMVLKILMYHQRKLVESIWKRKEDFFDEIIENKLLDEASIERQAKSLGFKLDEKNRVLAMKIVPEKKKEQVLHYLKRIYAQNDLFLKNDYIIMIAQKCPYYDIESFSKKLISEVEQNVKGVHIHVGSGRLVHSLKSLSTSYLDATRICDFVQLSYPMGSRQADFQELETIMMFLQGSDQEEMIRFYKKTIGSLVNYDREHKSDFLITLKVFLDNNGNLQQTADELHLSIAGLRYRMDRIESISGVDLKKGSGRFKCQLAIHIYFVLQIIND